MPRKFGICPSFKDHSLSRTRRAQTPKSRFATFSLAVRRSYAMQGELVNTHWLGGRLRSAHIAGVALLPLSPAGDALLVLWYDTLSLCSA
jgi:hypothetical protein